MRHGTAPSRASRSTTYSASSRGPGDRRATASAGPLFCNWYTCQILSQPCTRDQNRRSPIECCSATCCCMARRSEPWTCPYCRHDYARVPASYQCFCGSVDDPPYDGWLPPHSCGQLCARRLNASPECPHTCNSICHPGKCAPCAQQYDAPCACGAKLRGVRCGAPPWLCGGMCGKQRACGHKCAHCCHTGACPPCSIPLTLPCRYVPIMLSSF